MNSTKLWIIACLLYAQVCPATWGFHNEWSAKDSDGLNADLKKDPKQQAAFCVLATSPDTSSAELLDAAAKMMHKWAELKVEPTPKPDDSKKKPDTPEPTKKNSIDIQTDSEPQMNPKAQEFGKALVNKYGIGAKNTDVGIQSTLGKETLKNQLDSKTGQGILPPGQSENTELHVKVNVPKALEKAMGATVNEIIEAANNDKTLLQSVTEHREEDLLQGGPQEEEEHVTNVPGVHPSDLEEQIKLWTEEGLSEEDIIKKTEEWYGQHPEIQRHRRLLVGGKDLNYGLYCTYSKSRAEDKLDGIITDKALELIYKNDAGVVNKSLGKKVTKDNQKDAFLFILWPYDTIHTTSLKKLTAIDAIEFKFVQIFAAVSLLLAALF